VPGGQQATQTRGLSNRAEAKYHPDRGCWTAAPRDQHEGASRMAAPFYASRVRGIWTVGLHEKNCKELGMRVL
jgi:hypothetical protein